MREFTASPLPPLDRERPGKHEPDTEIVVRGGNGGIRTLCYCHHSDVKWIIEALELQSDLEHVGGQ